MRGNVFSKDDNVIQVAQQFCLLLIYSASVAGEETLHTYSYVQSHIKDIRWRIKPW